MTESELFRRASREIARHGGAAMAAAATRAVIHLASDVTDDAVFRAACDAWLEANGGKPRNEVAGG